MTKAAEGKKITHLLFVCEEKDKVSLAKSSAVSNLSSFVWIQKLSSERSSGPNWSEGRNGMYSSTKDVNGDNVRRTKKVFRDLAALIQQICRCFNPCNTSRKICQGRKIIARGVGAESLRSPCYTLQSCL